MFNYSLSDIYDSYKSLGIKSGDTLFVTSGLDSWVSQRFDLSASVCEAHLDALLDIVGPLGTLVVPTYSYTFEN